MGWIFILFATFTSNLATQDISLAYQMVKDVSRLGLISFESIGWESLSFCGDTNICGLTAENSALTPTKYSSGHRIIFWRNSKNLYINGQHAIIAGREWWSVTAIGRLLTSSSTISPVTTTTEIRFCPPNDPIPCSLPQLPTQPPWKCCHGHVINLHCVYISFVLNPWYMYYHFGV